MKLSRISIWFSLIALLALGANALLMVLIKQADEQAVLMQNHRRQAQALTHELQQEAEQLAALVRAYTATGDNRYLTYYFDILAIRDGQKAAPANFDPATYWNDVIAGRSVHRLPEGGHAQSISGRMKQLGFSAQEFAVLGQVVAATTAMKDVEKTAFAQAKGFVYDAKSADFIEGKPRLDLASAMVYSPEYNRLRADLSRAVAGLVAATDARTSAAVTAATARLNLLIKISIACISITFLLVLWASRVVMRQVLGPIKRLSQAAAELAAGRYATRVRLNEQGQECEKDSNFGVQELSALGFAFNNMARAIEHDVRTRAEVQAQLEAARSQSEAATHAKSMFLANMSHEIRTPMNAIIGMAHLALKTDLNPRQHDYISKVHNAAKSLLGIINDILDFSKVEAGKMELERTDFRLEDVVGNALSLQQQGAHDKEIELIFDVCDPQLVGDQGMLHGDPLRLGQILTNLLTNSVKFTEHGYVKLSVCSEQRDLDSVLLHFTMRDTGIGMEPAQLERLFQEFTQADGSTTRKYGGTGLGLTISRHFVELMGGTIWAESAPGRGTSFHFTARFGIGQPPEPQRAPLPPAAGTLRVLVVEDQPDARAALEATLRTLGIGSAADGAIDSAVDGANALAKVAAACDRHPYDVLLLDWVLPDMDGGAVLARLAQLGQQVPFTAVVSAYDTEAIDAVAAPLGVHHFLPKPVLPGALRYLISTALGGAEALPTPQHAWRGYDLSGMRVLLVEDNRINQQVASELIEMRGVEVVLANDGRQALDILAGHAPQYFDLVLMDLQMPLMDGYEATRQLRLQERYARLPIVAMTAHAMAEERERCDALGMNGHVSKPIEPEQLYAMLAQHYGAQAAAASAALAPKEVARPASGPTIAGIDSVAGLRRAGGKISLYLRLLSHFAADYRAAGHQLAAWLDSAEWDQAERLAHTLKGVAATIGADALAPLAGALETACHQQQLDTARQALAALQPVLAQQCAALDQHFAEPAPLASHADKPGGPAPAWLPRLRKMLDECDSEALLLWEGGHAEAAAWLNATQIGRINRALDNFEFDKALALLPPDAGSN